MKGHCVRPHRPHFRLGRRLGVGVGENGAKLVWSKIADAWIWQRTVIWLPLKADSAIYLYCRPIDTCVDVWIHFHNGIGQALKSHAYFFPPSPMVAVYGADSSGSIYTLWRQANWSWQAPPCFKLSVWNNDWITCSENSVRFWKRGFIRETKIIGSDKQILTTYNAFSPELPSRILCLWAIRCSGYNLHCSENGIVVYLTPFCETLMWVFNKC